MGPNHLSAKVEDETGRHGEYLLPIPIVAATKDPLAPDLFYYISTRSAFSLLIMPRHRRIKAKDRNAYDRRLNKHNENRLRKISQEYGNVSLFYLIFLKQ